MERVNMNISDIKVTRMFRNTTPNLNKMERCRQYYREHGVLDRDIIIGASGYLVDGYIGLLVLMENLVEQAEVVMHNPRAKTYVFGRHDASRKEYCWKITGNTKNLENLKIGNKAIVNTKYGRDTVIITRIETLGVSPVGMTVKGVVKCLDE